jgi:hypothetical protein
MRRPPGKIQFDAGISRHHISSCRPETAACISTTLRRQLQMLGHSSDLVDTGLIIGWKVVSTR